jgi:hypothetical protein
VPARYPAIAGVLDCGCYTGRASGLNRSCFTGAAWGRSAAVTTVPARRGCNTAVACCGLEHNRYVASAGLLDKDPYIAVADMLGRSTTAVATCNCSTAAASILNPGRYTAMTSMLAGGRPLAAVPAGCHSTAAPGILGHGRYTAAGGGHLTAVVDLLAWSRSIAVVNMLAEDRCTLLAGVRRLRYTAANLLAGGRRRPVAMTTSGVVGVEMAAGGRALVPDAAKLVNMHGVGTRAQPVQEAGHKEAGG